MAETGRSGAASGYLPRFMSSVDPHRAPVRDLIVTGVITSLVAAATLSPTLGKQFNALINASVILSMALYGLCALALIRFARVVRSPTARRAIVCGAIIATAFCGWMIIAPGLGVALPALAILAAAPPLWLIHVWLVRRRILQNS